MKNCKVSALPVGTLYKQLYDNNIYIRVCNSYQMNKVFVHSICLDTDNAYSDLEIRFNLEILRLGYSQTIFQDNNITVKINTQQSMLVAVKFVKNALQIGLKEAKDIVDEQATFGFVIINMSKDIYQSIILGFPSDLTEII